MAPIHRLDKIALLGDTHWGCRNDLSVFYRHFDQFFELFVDHLVEEGISHVFQLGDLFDRRKYINFRTLQQSKVSLFDRLAAHDIELHILLGNHDIHMKESLDINSPNLVLGEYDNIHIYQSPVHINLLGVGVDVVPWICKDNEQETFDFMKGASDRGASLCFGHFEIAGFPMYRGMEAMDGLNRELFSQYEMVVSGHYHTRSFYDNIVYAGTPYEMTWQDCEDPKGYYFLDMHNRPYNLEFYRNPFTTFLRLEYDDTKDLPDLNSLELVDRFLKVVVVNKTNMYKFDTFIQSLYSKGCYEVKILEDMSEFTDGEIGEDIDLEDTVDVMTKYIDSVDTDIDKESVKAFMKKLYIEAINTEVS